jgi:hypothetical protein
MDEVTSVRGKKKRENRPGHVDKSANIRIDHDREIFGPRFLKRNHSFRKTGIVNQYLDATIDSFVESNLFLDGRTVTNVDRREVDFGRA